MFLSSLRVVSGRSWTDYGSDSGTLRQRSEISDCLGGLIRTHRVPCSGTCSNGRRRDSQLAVDGRLTESVPAGRGSAASGSAVLRSGLLESRHAETEHDRRREADGRVVSNGAYRSRTGDLLLAKHDFHELDDVRRWKNHGTDALRTGRAYDVQVIRVIEVKQVADVADGLAAPRPSVWSVGARSRRRRCPNESPPRRVVEAGWWVVSRALVSNSVRGCRRPTS